MPLRVDVGTVVAVPVAVTVAVAVLVAVWVAVAVAVKVGVGVRVGIVGPPPPPWSSRRRRTTTGGRGVCFGIVHRNNAQMGAYGWMSASTYVGGWKAAKKERMNINLNMSK